MKTRHDEPMTAPEIAGVRDGEIDFSDIPEIDPAWLETAKRVELPMSETKKAISIRIDRDTLAYFKEEGPGYQTRMNAVLKAYVITKL